MAINPEYENWYIQEGSARQGPLTIFHLQSALQAIKLRQDVFVWHPFLRNWTALEDCFDAIHSNKGSPTELIRSKAGRRSAMYSQER